MKEPISYLTTAVKAAVTAGQAIMEIYSMDDEAFAVETKGDSSPLTAADRAAHSRIMELLEPTGIPVLSEEGRDIPYREREGWGRLWIVDPLDGTKEFIKRNGEFTVNIALVEDGKPVLGVVYAPASGMLYWGCAGTGSFRSRVGERLEAGEIAAAGEKLPLPTAGHVYRVVASKSHRNQQTDAFIAGKEKEHGRIEVVSRGSSLKICLVAEGSADIYPRLGPTMEWDTAAGHAVALYASAKVYRWEDGAPLEYNKPDLLNPFFIVERK